MAAQSTVVPGPCAGGRPGALRWLRTGPLGPAELRIGQALADVATIGLLQGTARQQDC